MKNLIYLIMVAIIQMMTVTSCDKIGWGQSPQPETENGESSIPLIEDSIKTHLVKQDSLYKGLTQQIDTLTKALNESKAEITELKQQVKEQKLGTVWVVFIIVSMLLSIFSVLEILSSHGMYVRKKDVDCLMKDYVERHKKKDNPALGRMPKNNVDVSQADIDDMRQRVSKLEQELKSLESFISKSSPVPVASLPSRVKYVKDLNSGYFMTLLSYKGEGCIFKVELKSETEGLFTLLSLDKLKTVNGLTDFVECIGNCKLEDAKNHEVKEMGTCKLKEKDVWVVTRKLKIKISK